MCGAKKNADSVLSLTQFFLADFFCRASASAKIRDRTPAFKATTAHVSCSSHMVWGREIVLFRSGDIEIVSMKYQSHSSVIIIVT
jgi:hypothetical protein